MGPGIGSEPPRLLGHPLHPATTHLPLGILTASVVWDVVALAAGGEIWWRLAWWCLLLGLLGSLPTVLTGLLEYAYLPRDHPAGSRARLHMLSALSALGLFAVSAALRGGMPGFEPRSWMVLVSFLGLVALGVTGWSGGDLVFRFGVGTTARGDGRQPEPKPPPEG